MNAAEEEIRDPDLSRVGAALKRAAIEARKLADQTDTPFYVFRDGNIVDLRAIDKSAKSESPSPQAS